MKYFVLDPQVATTMGEDTSLDTSTHPPVVRALHLEVDDGNVDDLQENFPCFVITKQLAEALSQENLTGFSTDNVKMTRSANFEAMFPDKFPQSFVWLKVHGSPDLDDFGIGNNYRLVVSGRALEVLKRFSISGCVITKSPPNK